MTSRVHDIYTVLIIPRPIPGPQVIHSTRKEQSDVAVAIQNPTVASAPIANAAVCNSNSTTRFATTAQCESASQIRAPKEERSGRSLTRTAGRFRTARQLTEPGILDSGAGIPGPGFRDLVSGIWFPGLGFRDWAHVGDVIRGGAAITCT